MFTNSQPHLFTNRLYIHGDSWYIRLNDIGGRNDVKYMHWVELINNRTQVMYHTVWSWTETLLFDTPGHMTTRR